MQRPLEQFVDALNTVVEAYDRRWELLVDHAQPLLEAFIADMRWMGALLTEPREGRSVQHLLWLDPQEAYTIVSAVFWPGYSTPIHDHGTWGLVGLWRGREQEERYGWHPMPDGSGPLVLQETVIHEIGSVSCLVPPHREIHRIRNLSEAPSCSIHIYGGNIDGKPRRQFDPESGLARPFETFVVRHETDGNP